MFYAPLQALGKTRKSTQIFSARFQYLNYIISLAQIGPCGIQSSFPRCPRAVCAAQLSHQGSAQSLEQPQSTVEAQRQTVGHRAGAVSPEHLASDPAQVLLPPTPLCTKIPFLPSLTSAGTSPSSVVLGQQIHFPRPGEEPGQILLQAPYF